MTGSSTIGPDAVQPTLDHRDDATTETYHGRFEAGLDSALVAVVDLVSAATGDPPARLEPLADVLDPDALDALVGGRGVEVRFTYSGCAVAVSSDGDIVVHSDEASGGC